MTLSWPNHLLTLEDWEALPGDSALRLELVEGVLAVVPQPDSWHQRAGSRLTHRTDDQLPPELVALGAPRPASRSTGSSIWAHRRPCWPTRWSPAPMRCPPSTPAAALDVAGRPVAIDRDALTRR